MSDFISFVWKASHFHERSCLMVSLQISCSLFSATLRAQSGDPFFFVLIIPDSPVQLTNFMHSILSVNLL